MWPDPSAAIDMLGYAHHDRAAQRTGGSRRSTVRISPRFLEQRLQRRVLERLRGLGVVEHLLKRLLYTQRFPDFLYGPVVGIREDVRWCLLLDQPILDFLPGQGAVPALRESLKILDPVKAGFGGVAASEVCQGVVEVLVKVIVEADRDEKPRVVVEQHIPGVVNADIRIRLPCPSRSTPKARRDPIDSRLAAPRLHLPDAAELGHRPARQALSWHSGLRCRLGSHGYFLPVINCLWLFSQH